MLYLIESLQSNGKCDFKTTKFPNKELVANYLKNNPVLTSDKYIIINGELEQSKGRYVYDGRFQ